MSIIAHMWGDKERQANLIPTDHPDFATIKLIEAALRLSWGEDVCNEGDRQFWTPDNPAFGQCVVSTLVLMELLHEGRVLKDADHDHYWLADEYGEIDLTREQFPTDFTISPTGQSSRERLLTGPRAEAARTKERFEALLARVLVFLRPSSF